MDPLREQALRRIDRLLEVLKAWIAAAVAAGEALEHREDVGEEVLREVLDTFDEARADFEQQSDRMGAVTVDLEDRDYKDPEFSFLDAAGKGHVGAAGVKALYVALCDPRCRSLGSPGQEPHWLKYARQLEQALLKARGAVCSDAQERLKPKGDEQGGPWSDPDTPKRWAVKFKVKPPTFKRWVKKGKIRAKILSDRSYRIHLEDLPQSKADPAK